MEKFQYKALRILRCQHVHGVFGNLKYVYVMPLFSYSFFKKFYLYCNSQQSLQFIIELHRKLLRPRLTFMGKKIVSVLMSFDISGSKIPKWCLFWRGAWVWDTNKRKGHQDQERHKEGERRETVTLIEGDFQNKSKFLLNLL